MIIEALLAIVVIGWVVVFFAGAWSGDMGLGMTCAYLGWLWPLATLVVGGLYLYFVYVHKSPS